MCRFLTILVSPDLNNNNNKKKQLSHPPPQKTLSFSLSAILGMFVFSVEDFITCSVNDANIPCLFHEVSQLKMQELCVLNPSRNHPVT